MKDMLIPIDQAGRIVLPKDVREELDIRPGDMLKLSMQGTHVTLSPNEAKSGFQRRGKALVFTSATGATFGHEVVDGLLNELRDERTLPAINAHRSKRRKA